MAVFLTILVIFVPIALIIVSAISEEPIAHSIGLIIGGIGLLFGFPLLSEVLNHEEHTTAIELIIHENTEPHIKELHKTFMIDGTLAAKEYEELIRVYKESLNKTEK